MFKTKSTLWFCRTYYEVIMRFVIWTNIEYVCRLYFITSLINLSFLQYSDCGFQQTMMIFEKGGNELENAILFRIIQISSQSSPLAFQVWSSNVYDLRNIDNTATWNLTLDHRRIRKSINWDQTKYTDYRLEFKIWLKVWNNNYLHSAQGR